MSDIENIIKLWRAVVKRAVEDALYEKDPLYRNEAVGWFYNDSIQEFETVCSLADINEEKVRSWLWNQLMHKIKIELEDENHTPISYHFPTKNKKHTDILKVV